MHGRGCIRPVVVARSDALVVLGHASVRGIGAVLIYVARGMVLHSSPFTRDECGAFCSDARRRDARGWLYICPSRWVKFAPRQGERSSVFETQLRSHEKHSCASHVRLLGYAKEPIADAGSEYDPHRPKNVVYVHWKSCVLYRPRNVSRRAKGTENRQGCVP